MFAPRYTHRMLKFGAYALVVSLSACDPQVELYLFDGMDHGWAGGAKATFSFPDYESASELGWSFFRTYAW